MSTTPPTGPLVPYCSGEELAAHLGGVVDSAVAESCAYAATSALWQVVADPGWNDTPDDPTGPVPEGVHRCALLVGADVYRAGVTTGGDLQVDAYVALPANVGAGLVRKYQALWAPWARTTSWVG